jgi:hypothetical protein
MRLFSGISPRGALTGPSTAAISAPFRVGSASEPHRGPISRVHTPWQTTDPHGKFSDHDYLQRGVRARNLAVVLVLGYDWKSVLDCGSGDQRISQLDSPMNANAAAVGYEPCPGNHHRLTDRERVRGSGECERVPATCPCGSLTSGQNAELELTDCDH